MPAMPAPAPSPSFAAPVVATSVAIRNFSFSPQAITVKPGTQVTWTNNDADAHTVTFDADGTGSQAFQNGESFQHTFTSAGTFRYHCSIHPYMVGEVLVANR
jgi:plastocyanin